MSEVDFGQPIYRIFGPYFRSITFTFVIESMAWSFLTLAPTYIATYLFQDEIYFYLWFCIGVFVDLGIWLGVNLFLCKGSGSAQVIF
ncbi:MAG: hypothetical protein HC932_06350 [Thermales bacterium]|nr:hypothetical protein [Thermales bacterium]